MVGAPLESPVTGDNGYWIASHTHGDYLSSTMENTVVDSMRMCSFGSCAVSFINFDYCSVDDGDSNVDVDTNSVRCRHARI